MLPLHAAAAAAAAVAVAAVAIVSAAAGAPPDRGMGRKDNGATCSTCQAVGQTENVAAEE